MLFWFSTGTALMPFWLTTKEILTRDFHHKIGDSHTLSERLSYLKCLRHTWRSRQCTNRAWILLNVWAYFKIKHTLLGNLICYMYKKDMSYNFKYTELFQSCPVDSKYTHLPAYRRRNQNDTRRGVRRFWANNELRVNRAMRSGTSPR